MRKYFVIPTFFYIFVKEEKDEIDDSIELLDWLFDGCE